MNYQTVICIYLYLIFGIFISKSLEALQMTAVMIDNSSSFVVPLVDLVYNAQNFFFFFFEIFISKCLQALQMRPVMIENSTSFHVLPCLG